MAKKPIPFKRKFKKPTPEQILAGVQKETQFWANVTQKPTRAVRGADGLVRYQLADFPLDGEHLTIQVPTEVRGQEAA